MAQDPLEKADSARILTRRNLLAAASVTAAGATFLGSTGTAGATEPASAGTIPADYPAQGTAAAREIVTSAHSDLARVEELVRARAELAKASYDWGFGDWESALDAACHMGRRDIADLLIENGARPTLFYAAMTGNLDAVKAMITAFPGIQSLHGPHGIPLMAHARAGKDAAKSVVKYLEKVGYADMKYTDLPLDEAAKQTYAGTYAFGDGEDERFEIEVSDRKKLSIRRGPGFGRALFHQGEHRFHPAGAPTASIRFTVADSRATAFEVHNPDLVVTARRV